MDTPQQRKLQHVVYTERGTYLDGELVETSKQQTWQEQWMNLGIFKANARRQIEFIRGVVEAAVVEATADQIQARIGELAAERERVVAVVEEVVNGSINRLVSAKDADEIINLIRAKL